MTVVRRTKGYFFNDYIGIENTYCDEKKAISQIKLKKEHFNAIDVVHGGVIYSLADAVCGSLANYKSDTKTTLSSAFNFLKPVFATDYIYGVASFVKKGKKVTVLNVKIYDDKDDLKASGDFTYFTL